MWIDYDVYMSSEQWFDKRDQIIARCNGICEDCNSKKTEHVHHLTYERFGNELLDDLQGLCIECHQAKHPDRKLSRDWLLISDVCKNLNITIPSLKRILKSEGLIENIVITRDLDGKPHNTADVPTDAAYKKKMVKKKPRIKHKGGQRGPYVWDFDLIKEILKTYKVPQKGENKIELPAFMHKTTKTEEYNSIIKKYGLNTSYNQKLSHWEIRQGDKIIAKFFPSKRIGDHVMIVNKVNFVEVRDGFNGVLKLLKEYEIIQAN